MYKLLLTVTLVLCGMLSAHADENIVRKYGLSRDERFDKWVYDSRHYGVMHYGYYRDGQFHSRHVQSKALSDLRSLYPTNYRMYYRNLPRTPVRYYGD